MRLFIHEKGEALAQIWTKERLREFIVDRLAAGGYDATFLSKENLLRLHRRSAPCSAIWTPSTRA